MNGSNVLKGVGNLTPFLTKRICELNGEYCLNKEWNINRRAINCY